MKIISLNANGIRAAARKDFFSWLPEQKADFVCIQETKAQIDQLQDELFHPNGYYCEYFDALKKGYRWYCDFQSGKTKAGNTWLW